MSRSAVALTIIFEIILLNFVIGFYAESRYKMDLE